MKYRILLLPLFLVSTCSMANELEDMYFTGKNPPLSETERKALESIKTWGAVSSKSASPIIDPTGSVLYTYGVQEPKIVCAPFKACDLELQSGEAINENGLHVGDTARWVLDTTFSGAEFNSSQHVIIKPLAIGLSTTLVIATNRRTYHIGLQSHRTDYMPQVKFLYPQDNSKQIAIAQRKTQVAKEKQTIEKTGEYLGDLDFDYTVKGKAPWTPIRVYNDGVKTIIQMPDSMENTEAPALLVMRGKEEVMVNYRVQSNRYIVDSVFDQAILIAGVGRKQQQVEIFKGPEKSKRKPIRK